MVDGVTVFGAPENTFPAEWCVMQHGKYWDGIVPRASISSRKRG